MKLVGSDAEKGEREVRQGEGEKVFAVAYEGAQGLSRGSFKSGGVLLVAN